MHNIGTKHVEEKCALEHPLFLKEIFFYQFRKQVDNDAFSRFYKKYKLQLKYFCITLFVRFFFPVSS